MASSRWSIHILLASAAAFYHLIIVFILGIWSSGRKDAAILYGIFVIYMFLEANRRLLDHFGKYRGAFYRLKEGKKIVINGINRLQTFVLADALKDTILSPIIIEGPMALTSILVKVSESRYEELITAVQSAQKEIQNNDDSLGLGEAPTDYEKRDAIKKLNIIRNFVEKGYQENENYIHLEPRCIINYLIATLSREYTDAGYEKVYKVINNFIHRLHIERLTIKDMGGSLEVLKDDIIEILENDAENTKGPIENFLVKKPAKEKDPNK